MIFAEQDLGGKNGLGLLEIQREMLSGGEPQVFFLSAGKESSAMVSEAADENVDCLLLKPLTFGSLKSNFHRTLLRKLQPSNYEMQLKVGESSFKSGRFEEALKTFENATRLEPTSALALSWKAKALTKLKRLQEAQRTFEEGLKLQPSHFRCLLGLLNLHIQAGDYNAAYGVGQELAKHHTIPMKYIPDLIRVSIGSLAFTDVLAFYKDADALIELNSHAALPLSAGLVVCGLYFLRRKDSKSALDAFRKAEICARGNPTILRRILAALSANGLQADAVSFLARLPDDIENSPEVLLAEIDFLEKSGASTAVLLENSLRLLRGGVEDAQLYLSVIRKSMELGRSQKNINELIQEAMVKYPEKTVEFEKLKATKTG